MIAEGFTEQETGIIKNLMVSRDARYIADLIESKKETVAEAIKQISDFTGVSSLQEKLDNKAAQRKALKAKHQTKRGRAAITRMVKKIVDPVMEGKRLQRDKDKKIRSNQDEAARVKRERSRGQKFVTPVIDYTKKISVRIDNKTQIYINPGEDPVAAKENFLSIYKKSFDVNKKKVE